MNYSQTFDPLQASAMRQNQNSQLAHSIKGGLSDIQQGLHENAQYKAFVAKNKTATDAKANYYAAVESAAKEAGVDISKYPELANAASDIANNDISASDFMARITPPLKSIKETIEGRKTVAALTPEERGFRQPQPGTVGPVDQLAQPQAPGGVVDDFTSRLMSEQKTGTYDPLVNSTNAPVVPDNPANDVADPYTEFKKTAAKNFTDRMNSGMATPGDVLSFQKQLGDIENNRFKENIEKEKTKREEIKADAAANKKSTEATGEKIADARIAGYTILSKATGKPVQLDIDEAKKHPELFTISEKDKPRPAAFSGGGGVGANPDELKLRAAVRADLESTRKDDFTNQPITDPLTGEPTGRMQKVMIPGSMAEQILMGPQEMFDNYVTTRMPRYAKAVGVKQPDLPTFNGPTDPAFIKLPSGSKFFDNKGVLRTKK